MKVFLLAEEDQFFFFKLKLQEHTVENIQSITILYAVKEVKLLVYVWFS